MLIKIRFTFRDWSKSIGGGGPEQRGVGSCNFQLPLGGGSPNFIL